MAYLPNKIRANNNLAAFKEGLKKVINQMQFSGRFRPSDKGVPGHPNPDKSERPGLQKKNFLALRASVWSKIKGGRPEPGTSPGSATAIIVNCNIVNSQNCS